jgi:hypothetical protein
MLCRRGCAAGGISRWAIFDLYADKMKIEWRRGFFRAWVVLALAWIALVGWKEYGLWANESNVHTERECWDRLAKWPDGKPMESIWDLMNDFEVLPTNVEINKWRNAVAQKLRDCEAAQPILQRLARTDRYAFEGSLSLVFLPPLALLIAGWLLGWIVRGFRAST